MALIHNLGFPRIGAQRELKFALEAYWRGDSSRDELIGVGAALRRRHWAQQARLDFTPVGDFSFYDHVLDMSFTLGHLPERVRGFKGHELDNYFRVARGRSADRAAAQLGQGNAERSHAGHNHNNEDHAGAECCPVTAGELTKWFDTNYHYIVPEFDSTTTFDLNASRLLSQLREAHAQGVKAKPVIIGPVTYLALGKARNASDRLALLARLLPVYEALLEQLAEAGAQWVQIDEPILVTELAADWQQAFRTAYEALATTPVKLLLTTYFGRLGGNLALVAELPVAGVHLDAVSAPDEVAPLIAHLNADQVVSLGVVNGRNVWKADLNALLDTLEPVATALGDRLWLAPSCSLLHVPVDLALETELDAQLRSWLAFATQRLDELHMLATALNEGRAIVQHELARNRKDLESRRTSARVRRQAVQNAVAAVTPALGTRRSRYGKRAVAQAERLALPLFPTTTIGSFPQTETIRRARRLHRSGQLSASEYRQAMHAEIERCIRAQEALGLDVLVHGEAERNDMVEYFGEQLDGFAFSRNGWVQSYGSRCVKPPILYGDVQRTSPMTVQWIRYAQSLTDKPVKGMLTGPVTMLNWSFVRDDQPRSVTCLQIALAIREEVLDLERAGVQIIQIDEAALREGLPLRRQEWKTYLRWAIDAYRVAANGVDDATQIHTHMCYSEFNDIIASIADMDADVITIETSRSDMELLQAFETFTYPNAIGPGVYDIHTPNIPEKDTIIDRVQKASRYIAPRRLWVNPDCGLKTRRWEEVTPALRNMVEAAQELRELFYRS